MPFAGTGKVSVQHGVGWVHRRGVYTLYYDPIKNTNVKTIFLKIIFFMIFVKNVFCMWEVAAGVFFGLYYGIFCCMVCKMVRRGLVLPALAKGVFVGCPR